MNIALANPVFTVEGSADDADASNGPGTSYGPANQPNGSCTDGGSNATSTCTNETHLTVELTAQSGRRASSAAQANGKAVARSTLDITYDFWDKLWNWLFRVSPKLKMDIRLSMAVAINDGRAGASYAVFIGGGAPGAPAPSWSGDYSYVRDRTDPARWVGTDQDGRQITETNPGSVTDLPQRTVVLPAGRYQLTFEANALSSADGTVSITNDCILSLSEA